MTLAAILGNALAVMQASQKNVATAASNIANRETPGYRRLQAEITTEAGGGVQATVREASEAGEPDALYDMTTLVEGGEHFAANARLFEVGADLWAMLLSIKRD